MDKFIDWIITILAQISHKLDVWLGSGKRGSYRVLTVHLRDDTSASRVDWVMEQQGAFVDPGHQGRTRVYVLPAHDDRYRSAIAMEQWARGLLQGLGVTVDAVIPGPERILDGASGRPLTLVTDERSVSLAAMPTYAWGDHGAVERMVPPPEGARWTDRPFDAKFQRRMLALAFGFGMNAILGLFLTASNFHGFLVARWLLLLLPVLIWLFCYATGDKTRRPLRSIWAVLIGAIVGPLPAVMMIPQGNIPTAQVMVAVFLVAGLYMAASAYVYRWLRNRQGTFVAVVVTAVGLFPPLLPLSKVASWSYAQGMGIPTGMVPVDPMALVAAFRTALWLELLLVAIPAALLYGARRVNEGGVLLVAVAIFSLLSMPLTAFYMVPWKYGYATAAGNVHATHGLVQDVCVREGDGKPWRGPFELVPSTRSDLVLVTPASRSQRLRVEYVSGSAQVETVQSGHC